MLFKDFNIDFSDSCHESLFQEQDILELTVEGKVSDTRDIDTLIIGAGPAGLTALLLARKGQKVVVYESDKVDVGGLAKTIEHNGFRFDIGGHRFFSKAKEVREFWREILKDDLMKRKRLSRIFWRGNF